MLTVPTPASSRVGFKTDYAVVLRFGRHRRGADNAHAAGQSGQYRRRELSKAAFLRFVAADP